MNVRRWQYDETIARKPPGIRVLTKIRWSGICGSLSFLHLEFNTYRDLIPLRSGRTGAPVYHEGFGRGADASLQSPHIVSMKILNDAAYTVIIAYRTI